MHRIVRNWIEATTVVGATGAALLASMNPTWIERAWGSSPDDGNGAGEWLVTVISFLFALTAITYFHRRYLKETHHDVFSSFRWNSRFPDFVPSSSVPRGPGQQALALNEIQDHHGSPPPATNPKRVGR